MPACCGCFPGIPAKFLKLSRKIPKISCKFPETFLHFSRNFPESSRNLPAFPPATFSEVSAILPGSRNAFYSHNNQFLSIVSWPSDKKKNTNKTLKKLNCVCCSTSDDAKSRLTQSETYLKMKREVYYVLMIQTQWAQGRPIIVLLFRALGRPL